MTLTMKTNERKKAAQLWVDKQIIIVGEYLIGLNDNLLNFDEEILSYMEENFSDNDFKNLIFAYSENEKGVLSVKSAVNSFMLDIYRANHEWLDLEKHKHPLAAYNRYKENSLKEQVETNIKKNQKGKTIPVPFGGMNKKH